MVRIKFAPIVDEARGRIGAVILSRFKQTDKAYVYHRPRDPRSSRQLAVREKFRAGSDLFRYMEQGNYPQGFFNEPSDVTLGLAIGWLSWKTGAENGISQTPRSVFLGSYVQAPFIGDVADTLWTPFWRNAPVGELSWNVDVTKSNLVYTLSPVTQTYPPGRNVCGYMVLAVREEWRQSALNVADLSYSSCAGAAALETSSSVTLTIKEAGTYQFYMAAVTHLGTWPYDFATLRWTPVWTSRQVVS